MAWLLPVAAGWFASKIFGSNDDDGPNPIYAAMEARMLAEAERDRANRHLDDMKQQVAQLARSNQEMQNRVLQAQQASIAAAAAAQQQAHEHMMAMVKAERAANAARFAAENAAQPGRL